MEAYDLIFSIGEACFCTQILRFNNLQEFSYPFDWMYGSTFSEVQCDILYLTHDENSPLNKLIYTKINENILKVTLYNKSTEKNAPVYVSNHRNSNEVLKKYKLMTEIKENNGTGNLYAER